jgi:hypothetical protein
MNEDLPRAMNEQIDRAKRRCVLESRLATCHSPLVGKLAEVMGEL